MLAAAAGLPSQLPAAVKHKTEAHVTLHVGKGLCWLLLEAPPTAPSCCVLCCAGWHITQQCSWLSASRLYSSLSFIALCSPKRCAACGNWLAL